MKSTFRYFLMVSAVIAALPGRISAQGNIPANGNTLLTPESPLLTFGLILGGSLNVNYGRQEVDGVTVDYHHTELKPTLGILCEYRISTVAYEANLTLYREEFSFALRNDQTNPGRSYSSALEGLTLYLPIRISKLTLDGGGRPTNKIYAGLGLSYLIKNRNIAVNDFRPDLALAVSQSFRRFRPHVDLGFEKFLGRLGLQLAASVPLLPFDKKIRYQGRSLASKRSVLHFSLVGVYRFYKGKKEKDLWY